MELTFNLVIHTQCEYIYHYLSTLEAYMSRDSFIIIVSLHTEW